MRRLWKAKAEGCRAVERLAYEEEAARSPEDRFRDLSGLAFFLRNARPDPDRAAGEAAVRELWTRAHEAYARR